MVDDQAGAEKKIRRVVSRLEVIESDSLDLRGLYGRSCRSAALVSGLLGPLLEHEPQEVFVSLLLNGKHRITAFEEVSRGTLTTSLVHPREVFGSAVRLGAAALIVAHNHPSGDPQPSAEDLEVTRRLRRAGELLGISLLDHIVIGFDERYVSLRERLGF